ncbi:MAG: hypothetical protein E4H14_06175 [Candidatus Thorarchaeota archaeon]|nr:MAG: hypothetical protein E4H14_06175 [Candidatus Thorarchaeota archaeon]
MCSSLRKVQANYVKFNPLNPEHLEAFQMLCLGVKAPQGVHIRQHPTLRFDLDEGFMDVRKMMFHVIGEYHRTHLPKPKPKAARKSYYKSKKQAAKPLVGKAKKSPSTPKRVGVNKKLSPPGTEIFD